MRNTMRMRLRNFLAASAFLLLPSFAYAHHPLIEETDATPVIPFTVQEFYSGAVALPDPMTASFALYGRLATPSDIDLYVFTANSGGILPVEALVPVRTSNKHFAPTVVVMGPNLGVPNEDFFPFPVPRNYGALSLTPELGERVTFFEPFSLEKLYRGREGHIPVEAGQKYFLAVYDPSHFTGDYALAAGTREGDWGNILGTLKNMLRIKLGLVGGAEVPWWDFFGAFLCITGLVLGIGGVTVIDFHAFLGRKSEYWTEATTRTHKITKPLIWTGLMLAIIGCSILYWESGLTGVALFQALLALLLVGNGLYLTFCISPILLRRERRGRAAELLSRQVQKRVLASFALSFVCWWSELFLFTWYMLVLR